MPQKARIGLARSCLPQDAFLPALCASCIFLEDTCDEPIIMHLHATNGCSTAKPLLMALTPVLYARL